MSGTGAAAAGRRGARGTGAFEAAAPPSCGVQDQGLRAGAGGEGAAPPASRMGIAVLALLGVFLSGYLLLYKLGYVGALACGVGGCETVQTSRWAVFLGVPVPAWGVGGYALLLGLALAGLQPRLQSKRSLSFLLLGFGAAAFGFSAYLTALEAFIIHAWCRWCLVSAALAALIFGLSLAELPRLRRGHA